MQSENVTLVKYKCNDDNIIIIQFQHRHSTHGLETINTNVLWLRHFPVLSVSLSKLGGLLLFFCLLFILNRVFVYTVYNINTC